MRKVKQSAFGPEIEALLARAHLSDLDSQKVMDAARVAEGFADAALWVRAKVAAIGTWFLKPSMKH